MGTKCARYRHDHQVIEDYHTRGCKIRSVLFGLEINHVSIAGQTRATAGSVDSTGPWRRAARRSMAIWQWLTAGLITTHTTITPPSFCTTRRYSHWVVGFSSPNFIKSDFLKMSADGNSQGFTWSSASFINMIHALKLVYTYPQCGFNNSAVSAKL